MQTKKRITKKEYIRRTMKGGGRKPNLEKLLKKAQRITPGRNTLPEGPTKTNIINEKIQSLREYQNESAVINDFLREGLSNFCEKRSWEYSSKDDFIDEMKAEVDFRVDCIKELDELFSNPNTPFFDKQTVLFRGTDKHYPDKISKSYISTTKSIDHLFYMMENGDEFVSKKSQCCLNVLVIDEKHKIPYLDLEITELENPDSRWGYQQEILLPRGLKTVLAGEYTYSYAGIDFKTYVYKISTVDNKKYKTPDNLDNYDYNNAKLRVKQDDVSFLITNQYDEIKKLTSYLNINTSQEDVQTFYQEFELVDSYIKYISATTFIYFCTRSVYLEKCVIILNGLKQVVHMLRNVDNLCLPQCKDKLKAIDEKITKLLKSKYISSKNFIKVPKCPTPPIPFD